jgi:Holliday junction resolvase
MAFAERFDAGIAHERAVADRVRQAGWLCEPFGQALLSEAMRQALRHSGRTPVRWMPDLIAVRARDVLFIDAKTVQSATANFSIEADAYDSAQRWSSALGEALVYVFADFRANYCAAIEKERQLGRDRVRGPFPGVGPGRTPYYLVRKDDQPDFDEVFGA